MNTKKERSIEDVMTSFREMANLVLAQLSLIAKVMTAAGSDTKEQISLIGNNEIEIDKYEVLISDKFINAIVLYQPMASDLRKLIAVYRMTINLERIGDLVMNMTHNMETSGMSEEFRKMSDVILAMLQSGKVMVEKSLLSFVNSDTDYAIWTIKNDAIVDEMNHKLLINSISKSDLDPKIKGMLLSYVEIKNLITNIERIADHATNIAEATIYALQGTDVRHSGFEKEHADE
jgi:phosphate transport system protein